MKLACQLAEDTERVEPERALSFAQYLRWFLTGGTYFVERSLAASLTAGPWAPAKMPPRKVVRALIGTLMETPTLRVHAVGQEGWELASTTSWRVATVGLASATTAPSPTSS